MGRLAILDDDRAVARVEIVAALCRLNGAAQLHLQDLKNRRYLSTPVKAVDHAKATLESIIRNVQPDGDIERVVIAHIDLMRGLNEWGTPSMEGIGHGYLKPMQQLRTLCALIGAYPVDAARRARAIKAVRIDLA